MSNNLNLTELCSLFSKIFIKMDNFSLSNSSKIPAIQCEVENVPHSVQKIVHPRIRPPTPSEPHQKKISQPRIRRIMKNKMRRRKKRQRRLTQIRRIHNKPIPLNQIYFITQ